MSRLIDTSGTTVFEGKIEGGVDRIVGAADPLGAFGGSGVALPATGGSGGGLALRAGASITGNVGGTASLQGGDGDGVGGAGGATLRLEGGQLFNTPGDATLLANAAAVQVTLLGFYGVAPVVQPTVSAASLTLAADLLDALDALGLVLKTA